MAIPAFLDSTGFRCHSVRMHEFRNAVDRFLKEQKTLAGSAAWTPAARQQQMVCFWLLDNESGQTSRHRLKSGRVERRFLRIRV